MSMVLGLAISYKVNSSIVFCLIEADDRDALYIGAAGDCWFLSAMAAVGTKPGVIERLCVAVSLPYYHVVNPSLLLILGFPNLA